MKRFNILSAAVLLILVVATIGCGPVRVTEGDYYYRNGTRVLVYPDVEYYGPGFYSRPYYGRSYRNHYRSYPSERVYHREYSGGRSQGSRSEARGKVLGRG